MCFLICSTYGKISCIVIFWSWIWTFNLFCCPLMLIWYCHVFVYLSALEEPLLLRLHLVSIGILSIGAVLMSHGIRQVAFRQLQSLSQVHYPVWKMRVWRLNALFHGIITKMLLPLVVSIKINFLRNKAFLSFPFWEFELM